MQLETRHCILTTVIILSSEGQCFLVINKSLYQEKLREMVPLTADNACDSSSRQAPQIASRSRQLPSRTYVTGRQQTAQLLRLQCRLLPVSK